MKSDSQILEKELSYKLYGIFLKVGKEYGNSYKEDVYQRACEEELMVEKIHYLSKPAIKIISKATGEKIGVFNPDLVVNDKIIVEIKACKCLLECSIDQLIKYLEKSKYEVGYLANFGTSYTQIIRRVYSNSRKSEIYF